MNSDINTRNRKIPRKQVHLGKLYCLICLNFLQLRDFSADDRALMHLRLHAVKEMKNRSPNTKHATRPHCNRKQPSKPQLNVSFPLTSCMS